MESALGISLTINLYPILACDYILYIYIIVSVVILLGIMFR